MTQPRRTLPGQTYLITRRCSERRLFLKPIRQINEIVRYALGCCLAKEKFRGIQLHGYVFMGNHMHLVLTDEDGVLSDFMACLCAHIARAASRQWGRTDRFWSGGSFHSCELVDQETVLAKLEYLLLNPVKAGLVCQAHLWPGAISLPDQIGACQTIERPTSPYYTGPTSRRRLNTQPDSVTLKVSPPPGFEEEELREELEVRLEEGEKRIQAQFKREERRFLGRSKVLNAKHSKPPGSSRPTRSRAAPVACVGDSVRREAALEEVRVFRQAYREARADWLKGVKGVEFPQGTNALRWRFGVTIAGASPPELAP